MEAVKLKEIEKATCFVRATHKLKGRNISVTPENTASQHLYYGRIILDATETLEFETKTHETGLVCLNGTAKISTLGQTFELSRYDALYVPRDSKIELSTDNGCDLAEISSPVENKYPLQFVSFQENRKDPALSFIAGSAPTERDLNILFGKNVEVDLQSCCIWWHSTSRVIGAPPRVDGGIASFLFSL